MLAVTGEQQGLLLAAGSTGHDHPLIVVVLGMAPLLRNLRAIRNLEVTSKTRRSASIAAVIDILLPTILHPPTTTHPLITTLDDVKASAAAAMRETTRKIKLVRCCLRRHNDPGPRGQVRIVICRRMVRIGTCRRIVRRRANTNHPCGRRNLLTNPPDRNPPRGKVRIET